MFTLEGKRTTLRKELIVVGFVSALVACGFMWLMGERKEDVAGSQSVRPAAVNESSSLTEDSRSNEAVVLSAKLASAPRLTPIGSSPSASPARLPLQKSTEKAKALSNVGAMRAAVVESVSRSTITLKDNVLAPRVVQEKVSRKAKQPGNKDDEKESSLLEAGSHNNEDVGKTSDKKKRMNAGSRLGLPPLAEMEKECRRASLLESMPPSYCSCDVGEFEQMECGVSASVAKSVANN